MLIVFMNQMSGADESGHLRSAQVWIGEDEGVWRLGWRNIEPDGEVLDDEWYEGNSWNELLCVYRHRLAMKLGEGFRPLIEGIFHEPGESAGKNLGVQKLQCYSELYGSEELYTELCAWRRRKAASGRKAPYFIASNRVLRLISAFVPQTEEELLQLPGIGVSKASEHGLEWLEMTARIQRTTTFPLNWVDAQLQEEVFLSWLYKQKEQKYKQELDRFRIRRTVLLGIAEGVSLTQLEERTSLSRRDLVEELEGLEKEGYDTEQLLQVELDEITDLEQETVWKAFEELGDTFLKPVLQRVYGQSPNGDEAGGTERLYERLRLMRIRFRREEPGKAKVG
ncbi:HRDC domain-containing protein [Paenibacillus glucanolyticus]|uniref:HRDC domain-containing protein n=1 Tax=Paenibacillus glucanolyticus TaxID=59843 RepID=UPI00096EB7F9|nr:HRDC domain-containing protein [Paenibacillus glucanolyticus]OMF78076.1 helicase [Paenibacillus glucanolyticus]